MPKKNKKEMLEVKLHNRNEECLDKLICTLDTTEEGVYELEGMTAETYKTEKQEEKTYKKEQNIQEQLKQV